MIYCLGLTSEIKQIQRNLDERFDFQPIDDLSAAHLDLANLFLIGPSVQNPVRCVQTIVSKDQMLSIIILVESGSYNQIKQSLLFSMSVGKNTLCVVFDASANYSAIFKNAVVRTQQKRRFSKFNITSEKKIAGLTSPLVKIGNLGHILEHAPIAVVLVNANFDVIGANKASREIFPILNSNPLSLSAVFPKSHQEVINRVRASETQKTFIVEESGGSSFEINSSSISAEDGQQRILLVNDITARREKARRVSAILESLPHIAWTADAEGKIDYYNYGWYKYTHKHPSEGMGEGFALIIHPDDSVLFALRWNDSVKGVKTFQHASRFRRFDGEYRWHLTRGVPLLSQDKTIEMWVGTSTDVHDELVLKEGLERKVKERTKLLEETNAELEQFAHISSHDLQEPLRKIQTFAHIVKDEAYDLLNDHAKRYLDKIITTSIRTSKLLKDLLGYSKISQREPVSIVSLNDVIQQVQEDLELSITQTGATIMAEDMPKIRARPLQIQQLFYNIISNSLKYKRDDVAPVVSITCSQLGKEIQRQFKSLPDGEFWEIVVTDNGIGFEQQYAKQIFTVFQRLHTRSAFDGTGIGLAIAKKVLSNHGGEIFAVSSPGNGAAFHLILPAIV